MSRVEQPSFHEHDTTLSLWLEELGDQRGAEARDAVVRMLSDRGWRVRIDPEVQKAYPTLAKNHHHGQQGDLQVGIQIHGGRLEMTFYQDVVHENRHGGSFDFDKRRRMPYLIGKQYEATVRRLDVGLQSLGYPSLVRECRPRGMDFVRSRRKAIEDFHGAKFYAKEQPSYNAKNGDGGTLKDGDRVYFADKSMGDYGRAIIGTAYYNLNNMWWVLLPCGMVHNVGSFRLFDPAKAGNLKGRYIPEEVAHRRLKAALRLAVKEERYERAAILRDVIRAKFPQERNEGLEAVQRETVTA